MSRQIRSKFLKARRDFLRLAEKEQYEKAAKKESVKEEFLEPSYIFCDVCGKEFTSRGMANHRRVCK